MEISVDVTAGQPEYKQLARELLDEMQSFFADPANEAEFQEWKRDHDRETA